MSEKQDAKGISGLTLLLFNILYVECDPLENSKYLNFCLFANISVKNKARNVFIVSICLCGIQQCMERSFNVPSLLILAIKYLEVELLLTIKKNVLYLFLSIMGGACSKLFLPSQELIYNKKFGLDTPRYDEIDNETPSETCVHMEFLNFRCILQFSN